MSVFFNEAVGYFHTKLGSNRYNYKQGKIGEKMAQAERRKHTPDEIVTAPADTALENPVEMDTFSVSAVAAPVFGEPLEDSNGLTLNTVTGKPQLVAAEQTTSDSAFGQMLKLPDHKMEGGSGHAQITDTDVFKSGSFTVILDVYPYDDNSEGSTTVEHTALAIGNGTNTLRLFTATGQFGYGTGNASPDVSNSYASLVENPEMKKWYSVAMTYQENNGGNGSVAIYVNGGQAVTVADVGFKLSDTSSLKAMLGCGRGTAHIMAGLYDGIQVAAGVMDGETLCQMTADRYDAKKTAPEVTKNYCGKSPNEHDVWWEFDSATGTLTISGEGTGVMADYTDHYPLTGSGSDTTPWKEYKNEIKKLVVTDGVTTLGRYAFNYCNNLSEVVLADSVDSLRLECFGNCTSLTSIEFLGKNVEASVFSGCSGLKTASIPNVQALASTIFSGCTKLEQVTLPARVTDGRLVGLFYNCKALKEVKIPDGVTWVSGDTFNNCNSLTHVTLSAETLLAIKTIDAGTEITPETDQRVNLPAAPVICCITGENVSEDAMTPVEKHILAVLNGGSFADGKPVLEGKILDGWYTSADFTGEKVETLTEAGVYYAKWVCAPDKHTWDDGEVTKKATCTEAGVRTYTCTLCGETKTETIGKLAHTPAEAIRENEVTATCTTEGSYDEVVKCSACGGEISRTPRTTAALGHKAETIPGKAPTATETGLTEGSKCSVCGEILKAQKTIPATGGGSTGGGSTAPSVTTYRLTVNYVFEDGTQAVSSVRRSLSSGSSYSVSSPAVAGYTPDQSVVEGRLNRNLTVTVTYIKEQNIQDPDTPLTGAPVDTVFADVDKDAWYTAAIQHVYDKGWMSGVSGTSFAPNDNTTRGMIVTVLHRMENEPDAEKSGFTDVAEGKYYFDAVNWAASQEVVAGYGNDLFGPEDQITREQMVAVLYRYAAKKGYDVTARADLSVFTDADQISVYAREAMSWANAMGLVVGTSETTLSPTDKVTRAQMAMLLTRFENTFEKAITA